MRLSHYSTNLLFVPFSTSFRIASWLTFLSISCEAVLKSVKKSNKNQIILTVR
jgi:hypothetical protein